MRLKIPNFLVTATGPILIAYLLLMLGTTFLAQRDLRLAATASSQASMEKHASVIRYFYNERKHDLEYLSSKRSLKVYFSNLALGMSMEYGLRASLLSLQSDFQQLYDAKHLNNSPIYNRLMLVDNEEKAIVDIGETWDLSLPELNSQTKPRDGVFAILLRHIEHDHLILAYTYRLNGIKKGTIFAEVNYDAVFKQLLYEESTDNTRFKLLTRNLQLVSDDIELPPGKSITSLELLSMQTHTPDSSLRILEVPDTPFVISTQPTGTTGGLLSSPWYLIALSLLGVSVLAILSIGVKARARNLMLHTRIQESIKQRNTLKRTNLKLLKEIRRRRDGETRLNTLIETLPDLVWLKDPNGVYLTCNRKFERFFGAPKKKIVGKTDYDFLEKASADLFRENDRKALQQDSPCTTEEHITYADDGHVEYLETVKTPMRDSEGGLIGVLGIARDITERKTHEEKIRILSQAIEQSPVSVVITNIDGDIEYVNRNFEKITGYTMEEVVGKNPRILKSEKINESTYQSLWQTITSGKAWRGELINRKRDGSLFWESAQIAPVVNEQGVIQHYIGVKEDITLRKQQEDQIIHQAHFDTLTDLPNRFLSLDRLSQLMNAANRSKKKVAVLFLDLDDFKKINDTLGHDTGDKLLKETASRLLKGVRLSDTVGRLGGDEFIVLIGDINTPDDARPVAQALLDKISNAYNIDGRELILTTSIGIAIYPDDGETPTELLRCADSAMYQAKALGSNTYAYYTYALNQATERRLAIEEQLHGALERDEFYLTYQPQIDISSGRIISLEVLLRWNSQNLGSIPPDEFIPVAEHSGLIVPIGRFVLQQAMAFQAQLLNTHGQSLKIAVNLSPRQFRDPHLVEFISDSIEQAQIPAQSLELEITEGVLLISHNYIDEALKTLKSMDLSIAMDDFGTGYSSIAYLRKYPFDVVKIDKNFIRDITVDIRDQELINAAIDMAHGLGLKVVAEGVETAEQLQYLKARGCDIAQGYHFSRPLEKEELLKLLQQEAVSGQTASGLS